MSESKGSLSLFIIWFSMAISVIASVLFLIFLVGEGIPDMLRGKAKELVAFLPFLLLAMAGCGLSFFKPKPGAIMMIVGAVAIDVVLYLQAGRAQFGIMVVYGLPYIFPGLALLFYKK